MVPQIIGIYFCGQQRHAQYTVKVIPIAGCGDANQVLDW